MTATQTAPNMHAGDRGAWCRKELDLVCLGEFFPSGLDRVVDSNDLRAIHLRTQTYDESGAAHGSGDPNSHG
jgi:hypothetical protein